MCLFITMIILLAGFSFYDHGLIIQAIMSFILALVPLSFFIYKLVKNGRCIFGNDKDCNK